MTNRERRARQFAARFNVAGDRWWREVPTNAIVGPGDAVHIDGHRIERGADGIWSVKP